ncbi:ATP-binding protein [Geminicoccaceae bacterium 1502E]|nr:ATP-binding protein [Geminicoccaceae bacterium 1502E]
MTLPNAIPEESAEELYENAPCGYLSTLPDGTIVRANATFLSWTGHGRGEVLQRTFQEFLTVPGKIYYETHYAPLLAMQGFVREIAFDLVRKDGSRLPVLVNTAQRRDADGRHLLSRTTLFDATERHRYERELLQARRRAEEAVKIKDELIAMIGHDIRNPLASLVSGLRLLERQGLSPEQARYVELMKATTGYVTTLTGNILDMSRLEAGAMTIESAPFGLRDTLGAIVRGLEAQAFERGLRLSLRIDPAIPERLAGDRVKLGQVLVNLLGNALKFTERGGVELEALLTERRGALASVRFSVTDTGIGIASDRLAHVFEDYWQAGGEGGFARGGTGLGLAISRRLVELLGSRIEVASTPGQGSVFSFTLGLRVEDGQP